MDTETHDAGPTTRLRRYLRGYRWSLAQHRRGPMPIVPNTRGQHILPGTVGTCAYWIRAQELGRPIPGRSGP